MVSRGASGERQEIVYSTQCRMVFQDRPDWPGKASLRVSYFLPFASAFPSVSQRSGRGFMSSILDQPALRHAALPITVEQYHHLSEQAILSERTELLRGVIIEQMTKSPLQTYVVQFLVKWLESVIGCLLYTSPSPRDGLLSRMPSSA